MTIKEKDILIADLIKENQDVTIAEYLDLVEEIEAIAVSAGIRITNAQNLK